MQDEKKSLRHINATPKEHLFGSLRRLQEYIAEVNDECLRMKMVLRIEAALSWEPLICDVDDAVYEETVQRIRTQHNL